MALFAWHYFNYNRSYTWCFSQIPEKEFEIMKQNCLIYHEQACRMWLTKRTKHYHKPPHGINGLVQKYQLIASNRINQLYLYNDLIVGIVNPASEVSVLELKKHMKIVEASSPNDHLLKEIALRLLEGT